MARILIIEDEADLAEAYRFFLEDSGHEVMGIEDETAPLVEGAYPCPDVVILDERLRNGVSGSAAIPSFLARCPNMRIVVASADSAAIAVAVRKGAHRALLKPFDMKSLLGAVSAKS